MATRCDMCGDEQCSVCGITATQIDAFCDALLGDTATGLPCDPRLEDWYRQRRIEVRHQLDELSREGDWWETSGGVLSPALLDEDVCDDVETMTTEERPDARG